MAIPLLRFREGNLWNLMGLSLKGEASSRDMVAPECSGTGSLRLFQIRLEMRLLSSEDDRGAKSPSVPTFGELMPSRFRKGGR